MLFRAASFVVLALPIFADATAIARDETCSAGEIQCCNIAMTASVTTLASLGSVLGVSLPNVGGLIGLNCTPISMLNSTGSTCSAQPVCCTSIVNSVRGPVYLGCSKINIFYDL